MTVTLTKPVVGQSTGVWGPLVNDAFDALANEINGHEVASDPHGDRAFATAAIATQHMADATTFAPASGSSNYDAAGAASTAQAAAIAAAATAGNASYVPKTQTPAAELTAAEAFRIQPFTAGSAPFQVIHDSFANSGGGAATFNRATHIGWNASRHSGGTPVANKPALIMGFEDNYYDNGGTNKYGMEWYVEYWSPDGTTQVDLRPIYCRMEGTDSNSSSNFTILMDIGSDGLGEFVVKAQGMGGSQNALFTVLPTGITLAKNTTHTGTTFTIAPASGQASLVMNSPSGPIVTMQVSSAAAWYLQALSTTNFTIFDKNARAHAVFTQGTTATAATTEFSSAVIADGAFTAVGGVFGGLGTNKDLDFAAGTSSGQVNFINSALATNNLTIDDSGNLGTRDGATLNNFGSTGFKIGGSGTQKFGFWGHTPVAQQTRPTDTASIIALLVATGLSA